MPNLSMLPGQYTSSGISEIQPNESAKMESPAWGISDSVQDKQHPVRHCPFQSQSFSFSFLQLKNEFDKFKQIGIIFQLFHHFMVIFQNIEFYVN